MLREPLDKWGFSTRVASQPSQRKKGYGMWVLAGRLPWSVYCSLMPNACLSWQSAASSHRKLLAGRDFVCRLCLPEYHWVLEAWLCVLPASSRSLMWRCSKLWQKVQVLTQLHLEARAQSFMYCFRKGQSSKPVFVTRPYKAQARSQTFRQSKWQRLIIASIRKLNGDYIML